MKQNNIDKFVRKVRINLHCPRKMKKKLIINLKDQIEDYCEEKESLTYNDLLNAFGEPEVVADRYISLLDKDDLKRYNKTKKYIFTSLILLVILIIGFVIWILAEQASEAPGIIVETIEEVTEY